MAIVSTNRLTSICCSSGDEDPKCHAHGCFMISFVAFWPSLFPGLPIRSGGIEMDGVGIGLRLKSRLAKNKNDSSSVINVLYT